MSPPLLLGTRQLGCRLHGNGTGGPVGELHSAMAAVQRLAGAQKHNTDRPGRVLGEPEMRGALRDLPRGALCPSSTTFYLAAESAAPPGDRRCHVKFGRLTHSAYGTDGNARDCLVSSGVALSVAVRRVGTVGLC